jgi:drug/metabolite transporter (DMT)-like permease
VNKSLTTSWLPGYLALGVTWGASFLFIKWGLLSLTSIGVAFMRCFIGGATLFLYVLATKQKLPRKLVEIKHILVVAVFLNAVPSFLFAIGETKVSSVTAGIINATTPLMTVLVISLGYREQKINNNQWIGVVLGFFGVLLVSNVFSTHGKDDVVGIIILLLATLCYGISFPYSRKHVSVLPYSASALATVQVSLSALLLSPIAFILHLHHGKIQSKAVFGILILGAVGTGFAYIWNFRNVKLAGSTIASTVTYVTPVVAVILGALFLKEKTNSIQLVGGVLILISAALVQGRIKILQR